MPHPRHGFHTMAGRPGRPAPEGQGQSPDISGGAILARRLPTSVLMTSRAEKGAAGFEGLKLLLCENPLPPIDEAIVAAQAEAPRGNFYTEAYSAPLRGLIGERLGVPERLLHINAGSELILRQLFDRLGDQVHLLTPTYALFPDLARLEVPRGTTLVVIVNPNNPNGGTCDMTPLPDLLRRHPDTAFLVDEAFIDMGGRSVAPLVERHANLPVVRTLSKAHSLAGFRVGYAVLPPPLADDLNSHDDAYPLARPSQAAARATLAHEEKIRERVGSLRAWTEELAADLRALGIRTYPTETHFFLADFAPREAAAVAARLAERRILVKPLADRRLGPGFMRITTARPEDNRRFLRALGECL
jgi:histidinol-phosphate aminotransferase